MMNTYVINNHQLTSVAVLVVIIAIASSTMTSAATEDANYTWIICNSHRDVPSTTRTSRLHKEGLVPPSQWDIATHQQHCFLQRTDTSSAPGTALFQHWLADFDSNITNDSNNKSQNTKHNHDCFDPWTDFPTWEIMRQYPDIGEDDTTRDYYTLWYTSTVDLPGSGAFKSGESSAELLKKDEGTSLHADKYNGMKRGHLTLHGVNYQPIVYYDGKRLSPYPTSPGDDASSTSDENSGGMFLRRHYDLGIIDHTIGDTSPSPPLEILVLPPPVVGKNIFLNSTEVNSTYGLEDGQGGDHRLAESGAIMQFTAGWDWIKSTPDRNTGIWDRVEVEWVLGDVRLHDLHVKILNITTESSSENVQESLQEPALPLGDDVKVSAWLDLSLSATYHGQGSTPIQGQFDYWITLSKSEFPILARGTIYNVTIQQLVEDYHIGKVFLPDVNLWWPHTYSKRHRQPLYTAHVKFSSPGSEEESLCLTQANFGVRTISSFIHPRTKSFALRVNGHPIFLTGGNWITTDQFLRYANSPKRYFQELSLLRHAGMNSIRVWGGGLAETDHFYDTADALGLIVYQEFWMTGDNNGNMAGDYDWPNDHGSYLANARDTIKKLRNHPSLGWYGGGNELLPIPSGTEEGGTSPPRDIEAGLAKYIMELDGSRSYITSSVTDVGSMFSDTHSLAPRDGPYGVLSEELFFDRNPGLTSPLLSDDEINKNMAPSDVMDKDSPGRNIGFQSEVGSASHPELESLKRFLSPKALNAFPDCGEASGYGGSIHEEWSYFKYQPFSDGDGVDHICMFMYPPRDGNATTQRMESIEEYSWAAQFAQYLQYKALFEGYSYQMWEWYSAIFLWKASSPAPTFRGALYDWLLDANGGYWGARAGLAGGSPIRLILNLRDWTINVINTVPVAAVVTSVEWEAYSLDGELMGNGQVLIPQDRIEGSSVAHLGVSLPWIGESDSFLGSHKLQKILLYRLRLSYVHHGLGATTEIARNSYFLTDPSLTEDHNYKHSQLSMLGAMRKEKIDLDASCTLTTTSAIECKLQNTHDSIVAIMIKMTLVQHSPTAGVSQPKDSRILPTLFSDNYLTLLPGETSDVYISIESMEYTVQKEIAKCFSKRSIQTSKNAESSHLMVLIDGWNVFQSNVIVSCSPAVMQPL